LPLIAKIKKTLELIDKTVAFDEQGDEEPQFEPRQLALVGPCREGKSFLVNCFIEATEKPPSTYGVERRNWEARTISLGSALPFVPKAALVRCARWRAEQAGEIWSELVTSGEHDQFVVSAQIRMIFAHESSNMDLCKCKCACVLLSG
jgi:hypothetical protein